MVSTKIEVDTMEDTKRASRRPHSAELKARVLEQCSQPGASVLMTAPVCTSKGVIDVPKAPTDARFDTRFLPGWGGPK